MGESASSLQAFIRGQTSGLTLQPRLPRRGLGGFMIAMSVLCVPLIGVSIVLLGRPGPRATPAEGYFFLVFSIAATLGFLLPGLYLATRWRRTCLDGRNVTFEKGWLMGRSSRSHALSEFSGLHRHTRMVGTADAGTIAGTAFGLAAAVLTGTGEIAGKTVPVHFLQLKHSWDPSLDVLLACDTDGAEIDNLMVRLADRFSLNVLEESRDGLAVVSSREADKSIVERVAAAPAPSRQQVAPAPQDRPSGQPTAVPAPPAGLRVEDHGAVRTILVPAGRKPLVASAAVAASMYLIAVVALFAAPGEGELSPGMLGLIFFGLGSLVLVIGAVNSAKRSELTFDEAGLTYRAWNRGDEALELPWEAIRNVSVGVDPDGKKPCLTLATRLGDQWLAGGAKVEHLEWARLAVLAKVGEIAAAARARQG